MSDAHNSVGLEPSTPAVNDSIVASTINYYGHGLLKQLADVKPDVIPNSAVTRINYHSFQARSSRLGEHEEVKFYTTAVDFILSNAEHLFCQFSLRDTAPVDGSKYGYPDKYKILPPIEYYLQATKRVRMLHFYKDVRRGDILICRAVQAVGRAHQSLKVVSRDSGPHMLLVKGISVMVSLDLSKTRVPKIDESSVPNTWLANTLLRVEVLVVAGPEEEPVISVGTLGDTLMETGMLGAALGKVARTDVPEIINSVESYTRDSVGSFDTCLRRLEGFKNPRSVQHLAKQMGLSMTNSSLMRTLRDGFPPTLQFRQLRRQQLARWAHKHVADGVAHFKRGEHTEAFQLLNKALSIDSENVEAFVAKGALLANMGSFEKAVEDFECALKHNPEHGNARKYICETLLELGKRHEEEGALGAAEHCYLRSLKVNPEHKGCFHALTKLHGRSGFKSSVTKELLEEMTPEQKIKAELVKKEENDVKEDEEPRVESEKITVGTESESAPAQPRERSLSPLSQKMAMQNNEWEPPSFLQTTSSYIHQQKGSPPPPPQLPTPVEHVVAVEEKKGPIITPFVIGHGKNAFGDAPCEQTQAVSDSVEPIDELTSSPQSRITTAVNAVRDALAARENNSAIVDPTNGNVIPPSSSHLSVAMPITTISGTQTTLAGGKSELDTSFENTMCIRPQTQDDSEALSMSLIVLSKRYKAQNNLVRARLCLEKSLKHNPKHGPTIKALHELTSSLQAPMASTSSPARHISPVYYNNPATEYNSRATTLLTAYPDGGGPPVAYSAFIPPPPTLYPPQRGHNPYMDVEGGVGGYSNNPPSGGTVYQNPYAPPIVMSAPPPHSIVAARPPTPEMGKWGATCPPMDHATSDGVPTAGSSVAYSSREDQEYHDRVDSFLNKLMQRSQPAASSARRTSRSDRSRSRDKHAAGARGMKRSRDPLPTAPRDTLRSPTVPDPRALSPGSSASSKESRKKHSKSRERSAKSKEPSVRKDGSERSRKRSKESKRKRKHSVSSSSSSSSRSSRSSSSYSSDSSSSYSSSSSGGSRRRKSKSSKKKKRKQRRHSKRSKREKSSKEAKEPKINLEDTPLLQGLDKEIIKKITEKIQQSNALALETKIPKKKKKKDKEESKKKEEKDAHKKDGEKNGVDDKSNKKSVEKNKVESSVDESSKTKKSKKAPSDELAGTMKKASDEEGRTSLVAQMKKDAALRAAKETTPAAKEFRALDIEKAAQKDTSLNIKALMELPGLEDLQKKLLNYYSKCDVKTTQDSPSGNGRPKSSLDEAPKSPMDNEQTSSKTLAMEASSKSQTTDGPTKDKKTDGPTKDKKTKQSSSTSSRRESKSSGKESTKSAVANSKSSPTDDSKDCKTNSNSSPPEEYGPPPPPPPTSGFKSSFQPLSLPPKKVVNPIRPLFDPTFSMLHTDGSILTPKEFRDGVKDAKIKQYKDMVTKAQNAASLISKQHNADEKRGRNNSTSPSSGRHSRSTSRSRRSRSSSRDRRSRSKSRGRRSRSRSRGRRSRSRSRDRRSRSRGRRSRSRSRDRRSRSRGRGRRSRSPSSRSRSRSPRFRNREGYFPQRYHGGFIGFQAGRFNRPGAWKRRSGGHDWRRSRSRSYSPRRQPSKRDNGASKSSGKDKSGAEKEPDRKSPPKAEMFGKWEKAD